VQDDTQGVGRVEGAIEQIVGQGFHISKLFTMGLSTIICQEERPVLEVMCGLSTLEWRDYQK
jgi:hypothetical protein